MQENKGGLERLSKERQRELVERVHSGSSLASAIISTPDVTVDDLVARAKREIDPFNERSPERVQEMATGRVAYWVKQVDRYSQGRGKELSRQLHPDQDK